MIAKLKNSDNMIVRMMMIVVSLALVMGIVGMMTVNSFGDDDENGNEFSFYKIASAAGSYYDDAHNGSSDYFGFGGDGASNSNAAIVGSDGSNGDMANAGAFLGFVDENYDDGFFGSTVSMLSSSSQARGYSSFKNEHALSAYVQYGHALSVMGLDSVANESFDIAAIGRLLLGLLMYLFYTLALSVEMIFGAMITWLQALNPFSWFIKGGGALFEKWFGATPTSAGPLDGLRGFVSDVYSVTQEMGVVVAVIVFFVGVGISLIMWKKSEGIGSRFRKFATRFIFILVGIPLVGGLYTTALNSMADEWGLNTGTPAANQILASTFVDFEAWAENTNLALPKGATLVIDASSSSGGTIDVSQSSSPRKMARLINARSSDVIDSAGNSDDWNVPAGLDSDNTHEQSKMAAAYDLIGRYMSSSFYHAADYETAYKAQFKMDDKGVSEKFADGLKATSDRKNYVTNDFLDSSIKDAWNTAYMYDGNSSAFGVDVNGRTITYTGGSALSIWQSIFGNKSGSGLSSLSMYNYLTTEFSDSSVITYSAHKATSGLVLKSHRSVNLIGDGAASLLYYMNALSMFIFITVLGWAYALAMLFNSIGRGLKMVTSVPFAMLGSFKAMAKVTTYGFMMIIEVIGTAFIYSLVIELFISMHQIIETPLQNLMSSRFTSTIIPGFGGVSLGAALTLVLLIFSIVVNFYMLIKMMKLRKVAVKAMNEFVGGMIDRLFSPNSQNGGTQGAGRGVASQSTNGDKAKRAVGAAAGMYGAGKAAQAAGKALENAGGVAGVVGGLTGKGVDAGDAAAGAAENAGGTSSSLSVAGGIEGADQQRIGTDGDTKLALTGGPDGTKPSGDGSDKSGGAASDEKRGEEIMNSGAESLREVSGSEAPETISTSEVEATGKTKGLDKGEAAMQGQLDSAMGTTTALEDDEDAKTARKLKAQGAADTVKGTAEAAVGVAEVAAGAYTGNAELVKDGAQRTVKGAGKAKDGAGKSANATSNVQATRAQKNQVRKAADAQGAKGTVKGSQASGNVSGKGTVKGSQSSGGVNASSQTSTKNSVVANSGPTNVNVKSGAMTPQQESQLRGLQQQQRNLSQAKARVQKGEAVTVGNKTYRNVSEVNAALRQNGVKQSSIKKAAQSTGQTVSKAASSGATKEATGAATKKAAAKGATEVAKKLV